MVIIYIFISISISIAASFIFIRQAAAYIIADLMLEIVCTLNRLINRILIGKPKKVNGVKTQKVQIIYNFVGEL